MGCLWGKFRPLLCCHSRNPLLTNTRPATATAAAPLLLPLPLTIPCCCQMSDSCLLQLLLSVSRQ